MHLSVGAEWRGFPVPAVGILGPYTIGRAGTGGGERRGHRTQSPTGYSWPCLYPLGSDILQVFILFFSMSLLKAF